MWKETNIEHRNFNKSERCIVLIPAYKKDGLSDFETRSLKNTVKILGEKYELALWCPFKLDTTYYDKLCNYNFSILRCSDEYFLNRRNYSNLCEMWQLYDACMEYEYMLICQMDAWVFSDKLEEFCDKGWDYVGAPHITVGGKCTEVGNGGLSLRKNKKFRDVCKTTDFKQSSLMEDRFWGKILRYELNLPTIKEAFAFSIQDNVEEGFNENHGGLPFGCHQPKTHKWDIWKQYIK